MQFKKEHLSPAKIAEDMQNAIANLDEFDGWIDYFEGGTGRTVLELVAGSQAIKNHYNMMRVRESSLQHAKMDSSITELAFNKGVYRPAAKAFIIEYTFNSKVSGTVQNGELIGSYMDTDVYSLESKDIIVGPNTLQITMGHLQEVQHTVTTEENFHMVTFDFDDMFIADHFQQLTADGEKLTLTDVQMNLYNPQLPESVISLVYANQGKMVFGDGEMGRKAIRNEVLTYRALTYNKTILGEYDASKINFINGDMFGLVSYEVLRRATGYLDKEVLRRIAIRHSVDGRWVETLDYDNGLMKAFGEYITDVLVVDEYPTEFITILPKSGFFNQTLEDDVLELVNNKRGNAVEVDISYIDPDDPANYEEYVFDFTYFGTDSDEVIQEAIDAYIERATFRIANGSTFIVGADIAVELTKMLPNGKMFGDLNQNEQLGNLKYIRTLKLNYFRQA